jgi:hypothetical protein
MSSFAKTTVLSLTLLAGAAFAAHAQSGSVAALPPGTAAAPPAAASGTYPGPNPGAGNYPAEKQTQAVAPSPKYVGPAPGAGFYPTEQQTQPVQPSPVYPGPRPN